MYKAAKIIKVRKNKDTLLITFQVKPLGYKNLNNRQKLIIVDFDQHSV